MDQTWDIELPPAPPKSCPGAVSPRRGAAGAAQPAHPSENPQDAVALPWQSALQKWLKINAGSAKHKRRSWIRTLTQPPSNPAVRGAGSPFSSRPSLRSGDVPPAPCKTQRRAATSLLHNFSICFSAAPPQSSTTKTLWSSTGAGGLRALTGLQSSRKHFFLFFFFPSKTPKNLLIPAAFPMSWAASHLHTKKPGQLGEPQADQTWKDKLDTSKWLVACHLAQTITKLTRGANCNNSTESPGYTLKRTQRIKTPQELNPRYKTRRASAARTRAKHCLGQSWRTGRRRWRKALSFPFPRGIAGFHWGNNSTGTPVSVAGSRSLQAHGQMAVHVKAC